MLLCEAAYAYSAHNLSHQKFLHLQLFGMSTTSLNPNGAYNNSVMFMTSQFSLPSSVRNSKFMHLLI